MWVPVEASDQGGGGGVGASCWRQVTMDEGGSCDSRWLRLLAVSGQW